MIKVFIQCSRSYALNDGQWVEPQPSDAVLVNVDHIIAIELTTAGVSKVRARGLTDYLYAKGAPLEVIRELNKRIEEFT